MMTDIAKISLYNRRMENDVDIGQRALENRWGHRRIRLCWPNLMSTCFCKYSSRKFISWLRCHHTNCLLLINNLAHCRYMNSKFQIVLWLFVTFSKVIDFNYEFFESFRRFFLTWHAFFLNLVSELLWIDIELYMLTAIYTTYQKYGHALIWYLHVHKIYLHWQHRKK